MTSALPPLWKECYQGTVQPGDCEERSEVGATHRPSHELFNGPRPIKNLYRHSEACHPVTKEGPLKRACPTVKAERERTMADCSPVKSHVTGTEGHGFKAEPSGLLNLGTNCCLSEFNISQGLG